ncbi:MULTISPECIES: sigma-70 family RNA polymerase sigma factor [unclassified Micromonospora]|uniref:RNA polymerase sigma factor n=1 Tax=unclassified Micromonospora TaxID=2617518 RepID=UPI0022B74638|nr:MULTISPECIES: sigma-70 family RNA polymerase sigma factor [unclassified Micromonospora]MCZ7418256.1 sigma-70 family RNA polymerase sigma factor [Verrucosispora sp. WMMA2121]WBB91989.1 sigma-70 family RNA polymerase sigma factor [Verrucosispora sp. WMMC514]
MTIRIEPTDQELWAATVAGDEVRFALLFDRYARTVYNHAFRLTGSWSLAEDVTQSAFLVAWRRRDDARLVDGSILPWLLVITTNTARGEARSARRWRALLRRIPLERATERDVAEDAVGRVDDERRMRVILAAVRRLPRAEREAVALCLWAGVSYADAAAALDISESSVRSRVSRARARLASHLVDDAEDR